LCAGNRCSATARPPTIPTRRSFLPRRPPHRAQPGAEEGRMREMREAVRGRARTRRAVRRRCGPERGRSSRRPPAARRVRSSSSARWGQSPPGRPTFQRVAAWQHRPHRGVKPGWRRTTPASFGARKNVAHAPGLDAVYGDPVLRMVVKRAPADRPPPPAGRPARRSEFSACVRAELDQDFAGRRAPRVGKGAVFGDGDKASPEARLCMRSGGL